MRSWEESHRSIMQVPLAALLTSAMSKTEAALLAGWSICIKLPTWDKVNRVRVHLPLHVTWRKSHRQTDLSSASSPILTGQVPVLDSMHQNWALLFFSKVMTGLKKRYIVLCSYPFHFPQSIIAWKYEMENSRNKWFMLYKTSLHLLERENNRERKGDLRGALPSADHSPNAHNSQDQTRL